MADTIWCRFDKTFICPGNLECIAGPCPYMTKAELDDKTDINITEKKESKMSLIGGRKFILSVLGIVCYTGIMILGRYAIDPLALGLGICGILAPGMAANVYAKYVQNKPQ